MKPSLELRGICVETSQGVEILSDVSLGIPAGQIMGLVGESGSGKSTTALAALGHTRRGVRIVSGQVRLLEEDLLALPADDIRRRRGKVVAFVPQNPANTLNPAMRVGDHLVEMAIEHLEGAVDIDARIVETLETVRLPSDQGFLRRYPHQLSGGQQQRIALAIAFICHPAVVVLDEPTTGLDVTTQRHVLATIRRLCEQFGTASLYVSHDLAVVAQLADRVSVMYSGRIVENASSDQLFHAPAHPYSRALLTAVPDVTGAVEASGIRGSAPPPNQRPTGCAYWPRCDFAVEECRTLPPGVVELPQGQMARCFRAAEVVALASNSRAKRRPLASYQPNASDALLSVGSLNAKHGARQVLHSLNFDVQSGTCLAIVGESGSGKTTLARCIVGLHREASGEIRFRGEGLAFDARKRTKGQRRDIQIVFQNPDSSLNPRRTVEELIRRPLELLLGLSRSEARARVAQLLDQVALSDSLRSRYSRELSGGERQRVAIARALGAEPDVLICDEVTSSLDVSVQASIIELLSSLRASLGLTMIFITHNLALIPLVADSLLVMKEGRITDRGRSVDVLRHSQDEYTRELLDSSPQILARAEGKPIGGGK